MTAVLAGGCVGQSSLDFGTPVNLHVWTTPATVEIDAPGWLTSASSVYVCSEAPPRLPEEATKRANWSPGEACQDFGTYDSPDGFKASIDLQQLDTAKNPGFETAGDWYVLLVALDGDRATSSISTRFHAPAGGVP